MPTSTERFYDQVYPHLATILRTAGFLTRDAAEAEDLAQETLLKAFRFLDKLQDGTDPKAWLMAILRNTRIDRLRAGAKSRQTVSLEALDVDLPEPPSHFPDSGEAGPAWDDPEALLASFSDRTIIEALQALPEEIRFTLLLVDVEQLDHTQAAEILEIPVGTVKSRAHRGRKMLRAALAPAAARPRA